MISPLARGPRDRDLPLLDALERHLATDRVRLSDALWLDVGAGDGRVGLWLAKSLHLRDPIQLDIHPRGPTVLPFDGRRIPLPDRQCKWVLLNWVLHHLSADAQLHLLLECLRVAERLFIQEDTPALPQDWESCRRHDPNGHFRNAPNWVALFESMGLRVAELLTLPLRAADDVPDHVTSRTLFVVSR